MLILVTQKDVSLLFSFDVIFEHGSLRGFPTKPAMVLRLGNICTVDFHLVQHSFHTYTLQWHLTVSTTLSDLIKLLRLIRLKELRSPLCVLSCSVRCLIFHMYLQFHMREEFAFLCYKERWRFFLLLVVLCSSIHCPFCFFINYE